MFALDEASLTSGHARAVCVKCGKCVDACPKGAIRFAIRGEPATATGRTARLLFLFVAFLFLAMMAGGTLRATLEHILRWAAGVGPAGGMGA
jgi:ferredoxin